MINLKIDTYKGDKEEKTKHPKCLGYYDEFSGDYDCEYGTKLICEECKYGMGRKDPEANCNQFK